MRLSGSFDTDNNDIYNNDNAYAYALCRDEINAQEDCNADILIEQDGKDTNPHKTKYTDNNNKYLGLSGDRDNQIKYGKELNEEYQL